jgi:CRP-like cAMP-binding protein
MRPCVVMPRDANGASFTVRAQSGGEVCDLTRDEAFLFEQLRTGGVQGVLQSKFGSSAGLKNIEPTVDLILRLHGRGLLEPMADPELIRSIERLATETKGKQETAPAGTRAIPYTTLASAAGHPATSIVVVAGILMVFRSPVTRSTLGIDSIIRQLESPAIALGMLWFAVLAASTIYSLVANAMVQGALPPKLNTETALSFQRRAIFFLMADFDSNSADMLTRAQEIRLRATILAMPWLGAGIAAMSSSGANQPLVALAFGFATVGLREANPVGRGQLVKCLEAWSGQDDLLNSTRKFLRTGLLRFDQKVGIAESTLATTMIAWLGGLTVYGAEILVSSVYELGNRVASIASGDLTVSSVTNAMAAVVCLVMLGVVSISSVIRLTAIPFQNAISLAAVPLRALRPKVLLTLSNRLTPESLCNALREMPIFASKEIPALMQIALGSRIDQNSAGQVVIQQGEAGTEFYVILEGEYTVEIGDESGQVASTVRLYAGDSFGELALLEDRQRAATVKAITAGVLLAIPESIFNQIFPRNSTERQELTHVMRVVKLLQESEALSYLTPAQTMAVARAMQPRAAKAGETIIREGDNNANCAYLIESGHVLVTLNGHVLAEKLSRGNLIGTTALVNNSPRTATVTCSTDVTCYELARQDFLDACSHNAFVALLLGNLTQAQMMSQETIQNQVAQPHQTTGRAAS